MRTEPTLTRLKPIEIENESPYIVPDIPSQQTLEIDKAAMDMVLLGLKTLSQKTIVAFSHLFTLLTCISAFVLWYSTLPNPNSYQLVGLALYAAFILLLHVVKRKG